MILLDHRALALLAFLAASWLVIAIYATLRGVARSRAAAGALAEAMRARDMLRGAPMIALLVDANDRLDAVDPRLADWLGLARIPRLLVDLSVGDTGLEPPEAAALAADVTACRRTGRAFARTLAMRGSTRVLAVHGRPASEAGRVVLWLYDVTETQAEIARLSGEGDRLRAAIDALSALIEAAPFPMWHRGPDLRLALVNAAYVRSVEGTSAEDVIARGLELVEGQDGAGPLAAPAAAGAVGEATARTVPATIAGERRTIRVVDVPLGPAGVAGYAIDVEELEQARADLVRFARAQRDMLDLLSAGVAQFGPDRALIFTNQPFRRLFALRPEWLADRPEFDRVLERMREANRVPESRDFPGWKAERRRWFLAGEEALEENWLLPDGVHLRVLAQPLPNGGLLLIFEDWTERLQLASARDTLVRARAATFDNLFEAIGVFASDGRLNLWNSRFREVWGLEEEELARHPRVDVLVEAMAARLSNPRHASLIRELVRIATMERRHRSGRAAFTDGRMFEFAVVPLPDGSALFTMLDVTDSRRIEQALRDRNEALEAADRLKDSFVARMSYELRTPLTSIGGFAEMLSQGYAGPLEGTAREYVAAILESVERLGALIDDVLDLTEAESGSLPVPRAPVDLVGLAEAAADAARPQARARDIEFDVRIEESAGSVPGDERRLREAIDHVLRNALAYTPEHGRVLLRASGDAAAAELVVSDNGPGIPAARQEKLFLRFQENADGAGGGRLLGLPLARQFIEAHGGTVTLTSREGEGTTVLIHLPRER